MNPYEPPKEAQLESTPVQALLGRIRTGLFALSCVFIAFRDVPHMRFAGLTIGLILVVISWGAIQRRLFYWIGAVISVGILFKIGGIPRGFQLRPDLYDKMLYGGVTVPMILGSIMFVTHLFVSGRLHE